MSIKVRAKIHPFKDEYKDFHCEAAPLSEIFAGLNSPLDVTHARFLIGDEMVTDASRTPPDGSSVYINVVPAGTGAQMKETGKAAFWAGLGFVALGLLGLLIPGGTAIAIAVAGAFVGVGTAVALGGAVLMNMESPTTSSRETGNQLESVRGSKNQARKLGYIPVLFGRHLITPDVAALPYTEIDSNGEQWLTQLFCAGYNDAVIETGTFKVGDTALTDLSETKSISAILAGTDARVKMEILQNGEASALYPRICVEQQFNKILKNKEKDKEDKEFPAPVVFTTADKTTRINVDIMFPQGLVRYNGDGGKETASVSVSIQYKPDSAPDSSYVNFPGWNQAISDKTVDMFRLQASVPGLSPGKYTVKITRNTADSTDSKTIDAVYTGSVRAFADDRPVREAAAKNLIIIALKIKATALANGVIDNFNFVAQSNIPDYTPSSNTWTRRLTKNPASMLLYALQGKINPVPVADADIDWDSLKEFWAFCNDKNYTCNAVQGDRELFSVLCAKIAKTGRSSVLRMNGKFSVVIDRERPAPVQLFSPRNTTGYLQTIIKADIPDEIALEFIDETTGWASNERSVYNTPDGLSAGTEKTKQASSIWGITDPATVFKFARYQYACITNRPFIHTLECDIEYLLCKKGDLIEYAGDTALAGVAYGKVTGVILYEGAAIGMSADTVFPQEPGKSYGIRCRKSGGQLITLNVLNRETSDKDLRFETPQAAGILEEGDLVIFGIAGQITRRLIVTEIAPADNFRATLTGVDYSPEIFGVDDPAYVVPPFDNKITTSGSVTDSGIVNTAEWQTWFTYHDASLMPERPTGGGTTGGWHRYQTPESRWVSLKTARSIADGDWGIPSQTSFLVDEELRGLIAGTADVGRPDAISGLTAAAGKDAIHITWNPLGNGLANAVKHIRIEIKKTANGDWQTFEVRGGDFVYDFNRSADGYPEKSDLAAWRIRAKAVSIYGQESVEYAPGAGGLAIDTSGYGTWLPAPPALVIAASGRTINAAAPSQAWYGAAGCEFQISKPVAGVPWYAPAMADTDTVYSVADSWKGAEGGVYTAATQITQQLPLEGQDAGAPKDTAYKYRARSITKAYDGSVLYRSAWGPEAAAIAKGTGVRDVVAEAIGEAQLKNGAVTNGKIEDETIDYEKFNPAVKPPRKVSALPANPYTGYIRGDTVILMSGTTTNDEKLYRLVNPAAAGTAGWSSAVDGADLIDETIAVAKMAAGVRPTRTVSALPALSDASYKPGDTVVLLGDSKVYRRTETGWIKTLDGVDILANTIQANSLNVLAKNVINPFVDGTSEGWNTNGTVVNVEGLGYVLKLSQSSGKNFQSNVFEVLPDDIYTFKFGVESLTELTGALGIYIGLVIDSQTFKKYRYNFDGKKWTSSEEGFRYFLDNYITKARKYYTTYILGSRANITDVPAPIVTDMAHIVYCLQLTGTDTACRIRSGYNNGHPEDAAWYFIQPQVYRMGGGRIVAENIVAHSITANEVKPHTLTAEEIAAHTLTANEIVANTISANEIAANSLSAAQLAVGDFTNYATVNENYPVSAIDDATVAFRGTKILDGYIQKYTATQFYLLLTNFTECNFKEGDEFYYEFIAKAAANVIATFRLGTASAITRNAAGVVTAFTNTIPTGATPGINAATGTTVHNLTTNEVLFKGAIKITNDNVKNGKFLYIFLQDDSSSRVQCYLRKVLVRKKNAGEMIVDGSIKTNHMEAGSIHGNRIAAGTLTAQEIAANTISATNLNVLAKNVVNPFTGGTKEGWNTNGQVVNVEGLGYVLKISQASGKSLQSNVFEVLPDDIYAFKFGIESLTGLTGSLGLYVGLTAGQTFKLYTYSYTGNKWVEGGPLSPDNAYFLIDYRSTTRRYFTTYILGSRANITDVPAPGVTDTTYSITCLQLTGTDTACRIRSGYNNGHPEDAAWYFIQPQVYRIGASGIVAENIVTRTLSAISALLGRITGSGNPNDDEYKIVLADGFSTAPAGQTDLNKKGTFLLGGANEESAIRRWWTGSAWKMIIRMSALILENLKSKVIGRLQVFGDWQNHDADNPVLEVNPGENEARSLATVRGTLRVHKSVTDKTVVFEATPGGDVSVPGQFYSASLLKSFKVIDVSALDENTYYPVAAPILTEGDFFEVIVSVFLTSGTNPSWSTHDRGFSCYQHMLVLPGGWGTIDPQTICLGRSAAWMTDPSIPPVGWSQMTQSSTAVLWLRGGGKYYVWDSKNAPWTPHTAAYTASGQTVQPQANQVFDFLFSTVYANIFARAAGIETAWITDTTPSTSPGTGALTVAGGVGIAGALNVGGAAGIAGALGIGGDSTFEGDIIVKKKLYFPTPTETGTLILSVSTYTTSTISLVQGWYRVIITGTSFTTINKIFFVIDSCIASYTYGEPGGRPAYVTPTYFITDNYSIGIVASIDGLAVKGGSLNLYRL